MSLTKDEWRALGFVGLLLALALVAHALDQPEELVPEVESLDLEALATTADSALESLARRRKPLAPGEKIDPNTASGFRRDRKSTRLNSSHVAISYAVFCLKKKKEKYK